MIDALSALQYPHWLMVAGAVLVLLGFIGFAFSRNRNVEPDREPTEVKANGKRDERDLECRHPSPLAMAIATARALKHMTVEPSL